MKPNRIWGRRKFLSGVAVGATALAGSCLLGRWAVRASNRRLRHDLDQLQRRRTDLPPLPGLQDLKGVVHVHSLLSPDSRGTTEQILGAAREAGLRFVMTTDHNNPRIFKQGIQGRFGDLRIIRGVEMIKDGQTILAINTRAFIDGHRMSIRQAVGEIKSQGGLAFVAHPWRFKEWDAEGIDGIEIYDIADAAYSQAWKAPWMGFDMLSSWDECPEEVLLTLLSRPRYHLSTWDRLLKTRKLVGIAGNDAHQNVKFLGMQLDPYALDFRFVQTHLLADSDEEASLMEALRAGHAYLSFSLLADATGFRFLAEREGLTGIMGDRVPFTPGLSLSLQAPLAGRIDLYRDGALIHRSHSTQMKHSVGGTGVYRGEISLEINGDTYPWIISNPIYVE